MVVEKKVFWDSDTKEGAVARGVLRRSTPQNDKNPAPQHYTSHCSFYLYLELISIGWEAYNMQRAEFCSQYVLPSLLCLKHISTQKYIPQCSQESVHMISASLYCMKQLRPPSHVIVVIGKLFTKKTDDSGTEVVSNVKSIKEINLPLFRSFSVDVLPMSLFLKQFSTRLDINSEGWSYTNYCTFLLLFNSTLCWIIIWWILLSFFFPARYQWKRCHLFYICFCNLARWEGATPAVTLMSLIPFHSHSLKAFGARKQTGFQRHKLQLEEVAAAACIPTSCFCEEKPVKPRLNLNAVCEDMVFSTTIGLSFI